MCLLWFVYLKSYLSGWQKLLEAINRLSSASREVAVEQLILLLARQDSFGKFPVSDDFFDAVFQCYFGVPVEFFFGFAVVEPDFGYVALPRNTCGCYDGFVLQIEN